MYACCSSVFCRQRVSARTARESRVMLKHHPHGRAISKNAASDRFPYARSTSRSLYQSHQDIPRFPRPAHAVFPHPIFARARFPYFAIPCSSSMHPEATGGGSGNYESSQGTPRRRRRRLRRRRLRRRRLSGTAEEATERTGAVSVVGKVAPSLRCTSSQIVCHNLR